MEDFERVESVQAQDVVEDEMRQLMTDDMPMDIELVLAAARALFCGQNGKNFASTRTIDTSVDVMNLNELQGRARRAHPGNRPKACHRPGS
jgi:hypothetical protein